MSTKNLILLFIIILLSAQPVARGHAQLQTPLFVTGERVTTSFPDSVTFYVNAQSSADIEKATLIYGTNGRSCQTGGSRQTIEFTPRPVVTLDWEWDLTRSGSLPPGTTIWWQWEIEDADGSVKLTERQEATLEDERFSWKTIEDNGVTVHWVHGDTAFGRSILNDADAALDRLSTTMGVPRPADISLWVYPTADDVRGALVASSEWAGGVAFPDYGITILGIAPGEEAWQRRVVPHELTHLVVGVRTFNCRGVHLPTWLDEGLARYAEDNVAQNELAQVDEALANGRLPTLRSLANGFSAYGSSAGMAYTQSYRVVQHLIETYGADKMNELLITMQGGLTIDDALKQVYGFDTDGLDVEWRGTTGYAATPTSAADALASQATPTAAATLALVNPLAGQPTATPLPPTATATAVFTPTPDNTPTKTAVPTATETAVSPATPAPPPAPADNPAWIWPAGGALLLIALAFVFIRQRRSS